MHTWLPSFLIAVLCNREYFPEKEKNVALYLTRRCQEAKEMDEEARL